MKLSRAEEIIEEIGMSSAVNLGLCSKSTAYRLKKRSKRNLGTRTLYLACKTHYRAKPKNAVCFTRLYASTDY